MNKGNIEVSFVTPARQLVGYSDFHRENVITTPVVRFDEETMEVTTRSGSVYTVTLHDGFDQALNMEMLRNAKSVVS